MAMNTSSLCLASAMDRLWYHQIILGSDPFSTIVDPTSPFTKFPSCPSPSTLPLMDETTLPSSSSSPSRSVSSDDISFVSQEDCSSEPAGKRESIEERPNNVKFSVKRKLNKSISCKSLGDLELEEVKGFMDLGFEFKRENLSPQMVKLLPGLQRLQPQIDERNFVKKDDEDEDENENENENENEEISRPYLSEAWTIKRPNSHILNLRMPKVSSACDMKKHLKSWAKTVASEIH